MMAKPMSSQVKHVVHPASYLHGTAKYGIGLKRTKKGRSILDTRELEDIEDQGTHLLQVVTDADFARARPGSA